MTNKTPKLIGRWVIDWEAEVAYRATGNSQYATRSDGEICKVENLKPEIRALLSPNWDDVEETPLMLDIGAILR